MYRSLSMNLTEQSAYLPVSKQIEEGKYLHYKGKKYEVLGVGMHSETLEQCVIYRPLYKKAGVAFWIRPFDMFCETVAIEGKQVPRFQKID